MDSIWLPLIIAFLYIALGRNILTSFHTFSVKWGHRLNLNIAKNGVVSINDYLSSMEEVEKLHDRLQSAIERRKKLENEISSLKHRLDVTSDEKDELQKQLFDQGNKIHSIDQIQRIAGKWEFRRDNEKIIVEVEGNNFFIIDDAGERRTFRTIKKFVFNPFTSEVLFIVSPDSATQPPIVYDLKWQGIDLIGTENDRKVKFTKLAMAS